ncbi:acyltransferase [Massilia terrae]|uniref:Acyltransferase n=1 Tax=Massilia terrae TaxID=1811224 RepID=A0ABT2CW04_9BURK|nr:acyltransferase [Massilia terrae]MCS0658136.1 acyltransferase [Massilia terrae]
MKLKRMYMNLCRSRPMRGLYRGLSLASTYVGEAMAIWRAVAFFPEARGLLLDRTASLKYRENITFGSNIIVGAHAVLGAHSPIRLGNNVRISRGVCIETATLNIRGVVPYVHQSKPIVIEDNVWLGMNCMVLGGVTIGAGSVVGAGAVVTKDLPPNSICVSAKNQVRLKA